ncbi:hypothetical protein KUTeg_006206, partial [Tegillarca granosa]
METAHNHKAYKDLQVSRALKQLTKPFTAGSQEKTGISSYGTDKLGLPSTNGKKLTFKSENTNPIQ